MREETIIRLPVSRINPDANNLRKSFDEDEIAALGRNMRELGQLEPIIVFPKGDSSFDLLDGERRWRAALAEGIPTLKAIVEERPDEATLICKKISRHLQTKGLSKQEEVRAIEEALEDLGVRENPERWNDYGNRLGGDFSKVRERMRVADLTASLRAKFESGDLPYTIAQSIGRIPSGTRQEEAADFILSNNLSGRFVTTQLVPRVLEHPDLPLMAVYDLARHQERWRYAKPVKTLEVEQSVSDLTDDLVDSFIKAEQALEEAAAEGEIQRIAEVAFYRDRLVYSVNRLIEVLTAFLRSYSSHFPSEASANLELRNGPGRLPTGSEQKE